ncbi:hypothetical protein [Sorangium sp. So ce542]|uniref:hypothetical protein n=1 Tax=Sorangium sp. So ce542 TaxID=3133316 RepID=UPI003F5EBB26
MLSGRALALAVLAWSLLKVVVRRLFDGPSGLALFRENYDADGLPPLSPAERAALPGFSRCIACGRCDLGEAERIAASRGAYPGLMTVVLASSRSMPDFDAAALALSHVPEAVLAEKEQTCPTAVPFRELARFVRSKASAARALALDGEGSAPADLALASAAARPAAALDPSSADRAAPEAT